MEANQYLRANVWPTGTRVQLMQVPWDSEYRDVVAWESPESRDAWFDAHITESWTEVNFNYLRPNMPVAVPVPYSTAYKFNYIAVTNPAQPVDDEGPIRTYYYFVTAVEYLSPQACNLFVQLDVMTTYAGQITLGQAFYDRGHIAMANENVGPNNYNEYLSMPEGIDVGREYYPVHREFFSMFNDGDGGTPAWCIVVSTADLLADPGTVDKPNLDVASGGVFDGMPNGCSILAVKVTDLRSLMLALSRRSWVAQCIIDIYIVPGRLVDVNVNFPVRMPGTAFDMYNVVESRGGTRGNTPNDTVFTVTGVHDKMEVDTDEPLKLHVYPYSVLELDTYTGNPVFLKPEGLTDDSLDFRTIGSVSVPNPRIGLYPSHYQHAQQDGDTNYDSPTIWGDKADHRLLPGSGLDNALWFTDFPHISIVNNQYQLYLASTANSRAYNYQTAGWGLEKSNLAAQNSYVQALDAANLGLTQGQRSIDQQMDFAGQNAALSTANGLIGGGASVIGNAMSGDLGGAAMAAVSAGMDVAGTALGYNQNMASLGLQAQTGIENRNLAATNADRNKALANYTAKGDYQNTIAGINAAVQDAALKPPSMVGQQSGQALNFRNDLVGVRVTWKTITGAARRAVADYFRRYGYTIHRWLPCGTVRHMLCMTKFAYIKLQETTITCADANETERQAIRGVFEKGVTLWDKPEFIGNTDLKDNKPRAGYRY